jgi:hypothetical protein
MLARMIRTHRAPALDLVSTARSSRRAALLCAKTHDGDAIVMNPT